MTSRQLLPKWIGEFCAPVVVTIATAEVESICLKNGLLLHELLGAFGKLDTANVTIRSTNSQVEISEAHIRFERVTEVRTKSAGGIEELLRSSTEEYDLTRTPANLAELKAAPPTIWGTKAEQLVLRSMGFSEVEMLSHPVVLLIVVATTDVDPVECMKELASVHHQPQCLSSGQYDNDSIQRVYLLLHDKSVLPNIEPSKDFAKMQAYFPASHTRFLAINSLPTDRPNLHQPDIWSINMFPMYFPQLAPTGDYAPVPINPLSDQPALGCCLVMEDFVALREFCIALYHKEILPCLERRIATLSRVVADARKGVKNVLKSFWRKPREDDFSRGHGAGALRYRFDRIEAQILLLADTCFIIKDYETASSMYKLVKEDFRSDKSILHLSHATLMAALCQWITEPSKHREACMQLDGFNQLLGQSEPVHACAYYALLASEVYLGAGIHYSHRAAIDAAHMLLQAASSVPKLNLLCSMLTERAAICFLHAGQSRKYALYETLCGSKFQLCGDRASRHAMVCFLSAMLVYEKTRWGHIKSTLAQYLALELKSSCSAVNNGSPANASSEGERDMAASRALLMTLKSLSTALMEDKNIGCRGGNNEAETLLSELIKGSGPISSQKKHNLPLLLSPWGTGLLQVHEGWSKCSSYSVILGDLPVSIIPEKHEGISQLSKQPAGLREVCGFPTPELEMASLKIIMPTNGLISDCNRGVDPLRALRLQLVADDLNVLFELEREWGLNRERTRTVGEKNSQSLHPIPVSTVSDLAGQWAVLLTDLDPTFGTSCQRPSSHSLRDLLAPPAQGLHPTHTVTSMSSNVPYKSNKREVPKEQREGKEGREGKDLPRIPLGESVTLHARLHNKLSTELSLNDLSLEIHPVSLCDLSPSFITIPPGGYTNVTLSAWPSQVGNYKVAYMRWNLGGLLSVRQPLRRNGPFLQKTLKQRAGRQRGEDQSLSFESIPAHPLLNLALDGLESLTGKNTELQLLQGQILRTTLTIKNQGAAPACEIFLKTSHSTFVFAFLSMEFGDHDHQKADRKNPDRLMPPWGQSSTVVKLSKIDGGNLVLMPGEVLRYTVWIRLAEKGKQQVSLLASYKAFRPLKGLESSGSKNESSSYAINYSGVVDSNETISDATIDNDISVDSSMNGVKSTKHAHNSEGRGEEFGPGLKSRTSFYSFQANVTPSVDLTLKAVGCSSSTDQRILMVGLANCMKPPTPIKVPSNSIVAPAKSPLRHVVGDQQREQRASFPSSSSSFKAPLSSPSSSTRLSSTSHSSFHSSSSTSSLSTLVASSFSASAPPHSADETKNPVEKFYFQDKTSDSACDKTLIVDLEEGCCRIEGVWILGSVIPIGDLSSIRKRSPVSSPTEKISISIPIKMNHKNNPLKDIRLLGSRMTPDVSVGSNMAHTWVLPLRPEMTCVYPPCDKTTENDTDITLESIAERFLCISHANKKLLKEVLAAKALSVSEAAEDNLGPRSISQVRRDNKKQGKQGYDVFDDIDIEESSTHKNNTLSIENIGGNQVSLFPAAAGASQGQPLNAFDLSSIEALQGSATVAVIWICKSQGRILKGMHTCVGVSLLPEVTLKQPKVSTDIEIKMRVEGNSKTQTSVVGSEIIGPVLKKGTRAAVDFLSFGLEHQSTTSISQSSQVSVPVALEILSSCSRRMLISVHAVDKGSSFPPTNLPPDPSTSSTLKSNTNNRSGSSNFQFQKGLRWENKTNYVDIELLSFESKKLEFFAIISQSGVFDLNRFEISARFALKEDNCDSVSDSVILAPSFKCFTGQGLIEIIDESNQGKRGRP